MSDDKFFITPMTACGDCPVCETSWDGGDRYEVLRADPFYSGKTDEEVKISASQYGWSENTPTRITKILGIEIPWDHPDYREGHGVEFYQCPECNTIWNRFKGEIIKDFKSYISKTIKK